MLRGAEAALTRLAALPGSAGLCVRAGQFIQAMRSIVVDRELYDQARMRGIWRAGAPPSIANLELIRSAWNGRRWKHRGSYKLPLPSGESGANGPS